MPGEEQLAILVTLKDFASQELRKLDQNVQRTGGTVGKLRDSFLTARNAVAAFGGALAVRQIFSFVNGTGKAIEDVGNLSRQLGLSTEALSELRFAAQITDVGFEELTSGFRIAIKNLADFARTGGGEGKEALEILGGGLKEAVRQGKSFEQLLPEIAEAFKQLSAEDRVLAASRLFGRGGAPLLQLLTQDMEGLREEARKLGLSLGQDAVEAADRFGDSVDRLKGSFQGFKQELFTTFGPGLTEVIENATDAFRLLRKEGFGEFLARAGLELGAAFGGERPQTEREAQEARIRDLKRQADEAQAATRAIEQLREAQERQVTGTSYPVIGISSPEALEAEEVGPTLEQRGLSDQEIAEFKLRNEAFKQEIELAREAEDVRDRGLALQQQSIQAWRAEHDALVGLRGAFADLRDASIEYGQVAREVVLGTRDLLADNLSNALADVASGTANLKDAFRDMARSILLDLQKLIIKAIVFRVVSGIVGGLGGAFTGGGVGGSSLVGVFGNQPAIPPLGQERGGVVPGHLKSLRGHLQFGGVARERGIYELAEGLPEAIVPLPDRRHIPVELRGGWRQVQQTINVEYHYHAGVRGDRTDRQEEVAVLRRNAETIAQIIAEKQNRSLAFREAMR